MATVVMVSLPDSLAAKIADGDRSVEGQVFDLVAAAMPPRIAEGQRYNDGRQEVLVVEVIDDRVVLYYPSFVPGRRSADMSVAEVQKAVAEGRWVYIPPDEPDEPEEPTYPLWVQPTGSHDAYALGAKVRHNGKNWESTVASNVWEPGVSGWRELV